MVGKVDISLVNDDVVVAKANSFVSRMKKKFATLALATRGVLKRVPSMKSAVAVKPEHLKSHPPADASVLKRVLSMKSAVAGVKPDHLKSHPPADASVLKRVPSMKSAVAVKPEHLKSPPPVDADINRKMYMGGTEKDAHKARVEWAALRAKGITYRSYEYNTSSDEEESSGASFQGSGNVEKLTGIEKEEDTNTIYLSSDTISVITLSSDTSLTRSPTAERENIGVDRDVCALLPSSGEFARNEPSGTRRESAPAAFVLTPEEMAYVPNYTGMKRKPNRTSGLSDKISFKRSSLRNVHRRSSFINMLKSSTSHLPAIAEDDFFMLEQQLLGRSMVTEQFEDDSPVPKKLLPALCEDSPSGAAVEKLRSRPLLRFEPKHLLVECIETGDLALFIETLPLVKSLEYRNVDGSTPLGVACAVFNTPMVSMLLSAGADVNTLNDYEETPFLTSGRLMDLATMKILIDFGAAPLVPTKENLDIWHLLDDTDEVYTDMYAFLVQVTSDLGQENGGQVVACYDYEAQHPDELSFKRGSMLKIESKKTDEKHYWMATVGDATGLVPVTHLGPVPKCYPTQRHLD